MSQEQIHTELVNAYCLAFDSNMARFNEKIERQRQEQTATLKEELSRMLYWQADAILDAVATVIHNRKG